ncbi:hypothetical protein CLV92_105110 [Kineococcus xinjiangensis]|uniref:Prepilin-type N-terminal cleavage/methylation domain-containing protein n=1 Tax=Kineococcus xinjiangensis TaxID=512762 RepID=A0A2S6IPF0_9ACTN|nr:hypothetical protein [Kineococcus xinjiangensis]PPK96010.1 hypothetical protein CLV92_105110 [Kineococcus xinjiangensis]
MPLLTPPTSWEKSAAAVHPDRPPTSVADAGFTLVEALMAMVLGLAVVTGGSVAVIDALRAADFTHQNAHAADLLREETAGARALPYSQLALRTAELAGDPLVRSSGGALQATLGGRVAEPVVTAAATLPAMAHRGTDAHENTTYRVSRYVTQPANCTCRRFSALVTWELRGKEHRRWASTLVADVDRGTSASWTWQPGAVPGATGTTVAVPFLLANHGNRDQWVLNATVRRGTTTVPVVTQWHTDANGDLVGERSLTDSRATGRGASGSLESGQRLQAVLTVPLPGPGTYTITATTTSTVDPTATREAAVEVTVP